MNLSFWGTQFNPLQWTSLEGVLEEDTEVGRAPIMQGFGNERKLFVSCKEGTVVIF